MSIKINVELEPFGIPYYVMVKEVAHPRQDAFSENRKFHISELDEETLGALCDEFRAQVFAKAGKVQKNG